MILSQENFGFLYLLRHRGGKLVITRGIGNINTGLTGEARASERGLSTVVPAQPV